jgi:hypothetical protein
VQQELLIEDLDGPWRHDERRLAVCMAASTALVLLALMLIEWPPAGLVRLAPPVLDVILERAPRTRAPPAQPEARPEVQPAPAESTAADVPAPASVTPDRTLPQARPAERPEPAPAPGAAAEDVVGTAAPVDWYAELERTAAEIGERAAAEPQSMHPEFDELRQIAALRYGPAPVKSPELAWGWETVEESGSGRTLLKRGNTYMVLDDRRLFNQEAFEKFEKHMVFILIPLGKKPPKNLPWVEIIRARYEYMREPDELPPLKQVSAEPED